jgi:hypothetical protein
LPKANVASMAIAAGLNVLPVSSSSVMNITPLAVPGR